MLNQLYIPGINHIWLWRITLFIYRCIWPANNMLRIFGPILAYRFLVMSLTSFVIREILASELLGKCPLYFCFLKEYVSLYYFLHKSLVKFISNIIESEVIFVGKFLRMALLIFLVPILVSCIFNEVCPLHITPNKLSCSGLYYFFCNVYRYLLFYLWY